MEYMRIHPRLTPLTTSVPHTHSSLPIRGLQFCAFPPSAKGFSGSTAQSPSKALVYTKLVPSSILTVLPSLPVSTCEEVVPPFPDPPDEDGDELDGFFFPDSTPTAAPTAAPTIITTPKLIQSHLRFFRFCCATLRDCARVGYLGTVSGTGLSRLTSGCSPWYYV